GATRGIGQAIANRLKQHGATVVVTGRNEKLLQAWEEQGVLAVACDVTKVEEVNELIAKVLEEYGRIDIIINNAGVTEDGLLMRMDDQAWSKVIETNLTGVFNVCRAGIRPML